MAAAEQNDAAVSKCNVQHFNECIDKAKSELNIVATTVMDAFNDIAKFFQQGQESVKKFCTANNNFKVDQILSVPLLLMNYRVKYTFATNIRNAQKMMPRIA